MKVLHVISDENIGGAGVLLTNLLRHFDPARVQSVVAMPRGSALQARVLATDIPIRFLAHRVDRLSARSVREIGDLVRRERVDLIHANAALNARIAGRANGVHVVHTRHCCFPPDGIWRIDPVRRLGGRWNAALSDRVVATAEAVVEDLRLFGVPREKIEVILNGSDPVREVDAVELKATRCRCGIGEGDFVVGICARLEPCKGHETFLRAAKEVLDRSGGRDFRFLIVGDG